MPGYCEVLRFGLTPYLDAWRLQDRLAQEIAHRDRPPTLLLLEHPHTFTFGRRGRKENLLWDEDELARRGVDVYWVDRGGDVTYHGPGQLVGYPLLQLDPLVSEKSLDGRISMRLPQADYVGYLRKLEQSLILALERWGVVGERVEGRTGVWVRSGSSEAQQLKAKIAAIGVKVDARGITRHGFALNVAPDGSYWDGIVGCGLEDASAASLSDCVIPLPSMDHVMDGVVEAFGQVFDYHMVEAGAKESVK